MNARAIPQTFVESLCGALAHQWEPDRLFMFVFTAYLDESGTHGDSPVTVMGGVLARAQQWKEFNREFDIIRARYGFKVFHTRKFKRKNGDFIGWSDDKCLALIAELARLTNKSFTDGVAVALREEHYSKFYKVPMPDRRIRLDSRYGLCFRIGLYHLMKEVIKRKYRGKLPPLHIVLESGHPNYSDAERIFFEVKNDMAELGASFLGSVTKAAKDESCELMIADFVAHSTFVIEGAAITDRRPLPPEGATGGTSIAHFDSTPEKLISIREMTIEMAKRAKARKRLAWEAGSSRKDG